MKKEISNALFDQAWWLLERLKNCIAVQCPEEPERLGKEARLYRAYNQAYKRFLRRQEMTVGLPDPKRDVNLNIHPNQTKQKLTNVQRILSTLILLAGNVGVASATPLPMPNSEAHYPGASATNAFVAKEPYVVNRYGTLRTISLDEASRSHDFSGSVPFINPITNKSDVQAIQSYSGGVINYYGTSIPSAGVLGRVDKTTFGNDVVTRIKYNAGDSITLSKCRTKLMSWPIPNRVHARFYLEMAFGSNADPWKLTPVGQTWVTPGDSPVLFFGITDENQWTGPFSLDANTDSQDHTKLAIQVRLYDRNVGDKVTFYTIRGVPRHTMTRIMIDMFLDERATSAGGKGLVQIYVNDRFVAEKAAPTMANATGVQNPYWGITTYLWAEAQPYQYNRAIFFKTAKMMVYP